MYTSRKKLQQREENINAHCTLRLHTVKYRSKKLMMEIKIHHIYVTHRHCRTKKIYIFRKMTMLAYIKIIYINIYTSLSIYLLQVTFILLLDSIKQNAIRCFCLYFGPKHFKAIEFVQLQKK
jgi:hypothetical protein